jgi:uncharacterized protein YxeA
MKNTKYKILGLAILIIGGYYIFQKIKKDKNLNNDTDALKQAYIDTINERRSFLETQNTSYLKD